MIDYYLRATDEAAMNAALSAAAVVDGEGNPFSGIELSVIGEITKDGKRVPGWHVNMRAAGGLLGSQLAELPIIDPPQNPVRMWFDRWHA
jgi:hypothetical protein